VTRGCAKRYRNQDDRVSHECGSCGDDCNVTPGTVGKLPGARTTHRLIRWRRRWLGPSDHPCRADVCRNTEETTNKFRGLLCVSPRVSASSPVKFLLHRSRRIERPHAVLLERL
jgi:hypothetical protein